MPLWGLGSGGGLLGGEDLVAMVVGLEDLFWEERVRLEIARRAFFSERGVGVGRRRDRLDFDIFIAG